MDGPQALSMALPKPGRALTGLLVVIAGLGVLNTLVATWLPVGGALFATLVLLPGRSLTEPWRLLTSGLLTSRDQWDHLFFSLLGLYFLGSSLERRWGGRRFIRFFALAVLFGNLATLATNLLAPLDAQERFHPTVVYGPAAAIAAIAVAWSREYPDATVNLMFVIPVRARMFLWITLGFCALDLIYPSALPEGVVAPIGGVVAGLLFAGSPSPLRSLWLRVRLALLRLRRGHLSAQDLAGPDPSKRRRPGSPPLRIVPGGLDEVLKKRPPPPKDKRYLN